MGRDSPSKTRTGSRKIPCAPSSQRPRVCARTGGAGGSSLPDRTPRPSESKVGHSAQPVETSAAEWIQAHLLNLSVIVNYA